MATRIATCPQCKCTMFAITDNSVVCVRCNRVVSFEFLDDQHVLCVTKANDVVRLIEGD
jgi:uncharacterized Zn finger protein (UPF0148 family)